MKPLTTRQLEIVAFIRQHCAARGTPPSLREIGEHMGIRSTNGVSAHLRALVRKGAVRPADGRSRSYVLAGPPMSRGGLPVWDECLIRYDVTDARPLEPELASAHRFAGLPPGWRLERATRSGDGAVAVFSVAGVPTAEDGRAVLEWLRERGAL